MTERVRRTFSLGVIGFLLLGGWVASAQADVSTSAQPLSPGQVVFTDPSCPSAPGEAKVIGTIDGQPANLTSRFSDKAGSKVEEWCIKRAGPSYWFFYRFVRGNDSKRFFIALCSFGFASNNGDVKADQAGMITGFTFNNTEFTDRTLTTPTGNWNFYSYDAATNKLTVTKHVKGQADKKFTITPPGTSTELATKVCADPCSPPTFQQDTVTFPSSILVPEFGSSVILIASFALFALALLRRSRPLGLHSGRRGTGGPTRRVDTFERRNG